MSDNSRQKIINDNYYDRNGFGSKATTLRDARGKDKSITMKDVEKFFRKNVEMKKNPAFAERFIRTFKDMLFKRVENDEKKGNNNIQWTDYILEIMLTYNSKDKHSATNMTPNEARKDRHELKARINVATKARKDMIYPEVSVGDKVKIKRKKTITEKERTSHFLKGEYTVETITKSLGQTYFKMTDYPRKLMRADIVKI